MKNKRVFRSFLAMLLVVSFIFGTVPARKAYADPAPAGTGSVLAYIIDGRLYVKPSDDFVEDDFTLKCILDSRGVQKKNNNSYPKRDTIPVADQSSEEYMIHATGVVTEFGFSEFGLYHKGTYKFGNSTPLYGYDQIFIRDGKYVITNGSAEFPVVSVSGTRKDSGQTVSSTYNDVHVSASNENVSGSENFGSVDELISGYDAESQEGEEGSNEESQSISFCDYVYPIVYNNSVSGGAITFTVNGTDASMDPEKWPRILYDGVDEGSNMVDGVSVKSTYPKPGNTNAPAFYDSVDAIPTETTGANSLDHMDKLSLYIDGQLAEVRYWDQISKIWYHENTAHEYVNMIYVEGDHTFKRGDWRDAAQCHSVSDKYVNMKQLWKSIYDPLSMYQPADAAEYGNLPENIRNYAVLSGEYISSLLQEAENEAIKNIIAGVEPHTLDPNTYYSKSLFIADSYLRYKDDNSIPLPSLDDTMWTSNDDSKDRYNVKVSDYWLGKYEVTMEQFYRFVDDCTVEQDIPNGWRTGQSVDQTGDAPKVYYQVNGQKYYLNEVAAYAIADKHDKARDNGWGLGSRPAIDVNWYEAVEFCNYLSRKEGYTPCYTFRNIYNGTYGDGKTTVDFLANVRGSAMQKIKQSKKDIQLVEVSCDFSQNGYRLPTESEYEYAARGGKLTFTDDESLYDDDDKLALYAGMNSFDTDNLPSYAWWRKDTDNPQYNGDSSASIPNNNMGANGYSSPVGSRLPNQLGLHDMSGSVWEATWDYYNRGYYAAQQQLGTTIVDERGPQYTVAQISDMSPSVVVDETMRDQWQYTYNIPAVDGTNIWDSREILVADNRSGAGKLSHTLRGGCFTNPYILVATVNRYGPAQTFVQNCINFTDARVGFRLARTATAQDEALRVSDADTVKAENEVRRKIHENSTQIDGSTYEYQDIADIRLTKGNAANEINAVVAATYYDDKNTSYQKAVTRIYNMTVTIADDGSVSSTAPQLEKTAQPPQTKEFRAYPQIKKVTWTIKYLADSDTVTEESASVDEDIDYSQNFTPKKLSEIDAAYTDDDYNDAVIVTEGNTITVTYTKKQTQPDNPDPVNPDPVNPNPVNPDPDNSKPIIYYVPDPSIDDNSSNSQNTDDPGKNTGDSGSSENIQDLSRTEVTTKKTGSKKITTTRVYDRLGTIQSYTVVKEYTKTGKTETETAEYSNGKIRSFTVIAEDNGKITKKKIYTSDKGINLRLKELYVDKSKATVATSVSIDGKKYKVSTILPEAFDENIKLKTLVIDGYISKIKQDAFAGLPEGTVLKAKNMTDKQFKKIKKSIRGSGLADDHKIVKSK
ncbi:MAG: SUMF1/EgtB/PvdO family nonheme iron enzyme [Lachnospiraceae bacterium]|nr:SUMF1/EgtB/PvdO family nonheme iron enzyme [Lachnospiraceae bacterium]